MRSLIRLNRTGHNWRPLTEARSSNKTTGKLAGHAALPEVHASELSRHLSTGNKSLHLSGHFKDKKSKLNALKISTTFNDLSEYHLFIYSHANQY